MARQLRNGKATATNSGDEEVKREDDVELVEGGGFIIEKKKRNSRARKQTLKNEEQGEEVSQPATRTRKLTTRYHLLLCGSVNLAAAA